MRLIQNLFTIAPGKPSGAALFVIILLAIVALIYTVYKSGGGSGDGDED